MTDREELIAALEDAVEEMRDMIAYVPDYFRVKWQHDESLARVTAALNKAKESASS